MYFRSWWNNDKGHCECKKRHVCKKDDSKKGQHAVAEIENV